MARRLKNILRSAVRIFWGTLLFGIISLAVTVQLGRAVFPILDDYRALVEAQLSRQLQVNVSIGAIEAQWEGLRPQLHLLDVEVSNDLGVPVFEVRQVDVEVGLLASVRDWRLAFRKLTFSGLDAVIIQHDNGRWSVRGLDQIRDDLSDPDRFSINDPLDVFLFGRRVEMLDTSFSFHFRSGLLSDIAIPTIRLENDADFHRLAAEFSIDSGEQALQLIVEGKGDPRNTETFDARGYLSLNAFPSEKVLAAVGIPSDVLLGEEGDGLRPNWQNTGQVDLRLWFDGTSAKGLRWRGDMNVRGVPVIPPEGMLWPESLSTDFSGDWHPEAGWHLDLAEASLAWPNFTAPPLNARLRGKLGEPSLLQMAQLDVYAWQQVIARAGLLPKRAQDVLQELAPFGELRNLLLTQTSADQGFFELRANVHQAGVRAWRGVPAIEGINGYVEANAFAGHVTIHSDAGVVLDFPKIYNQPLPVQTAAGDVRWLIDKEQRSVAISSGIMQVSNDDIAATGQFNLRLPFVASPGVEPELTLAVGVRKGAARLHRLLVPYTVPDGLYQWLEDSIQRGVVSDASFIYHGSLLKDHQLARIIQLSATVEGGELVFDQNWPSLTDASAAIVLDDDNFYVSNLQGQILGVAISNADVALARLPESDGRAIALRGHIKGDSGKALNLLKNSPIKDLLGEQLESWQLSGSFDGFLDLLIPLEADVVGGRQTVKVQLDDNQLYLPQLNLTFDDIRGPFTYSSRDGVNSEGLHAHLWGQALQAQLSSQWTSEQKSVRLDYSGQVDVEQLQQWAKRPELSFASGITEVSGTIAVPFDDDAPLHLTASSTLRGVHVDLPEPLLKAEQDTHAMQMDIYAHPASNAQSGYVEYDLRLQGQAQMRIRARDGDMEGISLAIGVPAPAVKKGSIGISGVLPTVDLPAWKQALDRYLERSAVSDTAADKGQSEPPMPVSIALNLEQMQIGGLAFDDVFVEGGRQQEEWTFDVQSPAMAGRYRVAEGQPLDMRLSYLHLPLADPAASPEVQAGAADVSQLAKLDITELGAVDFFCEELQLGARKLGQWQFRLRPVNGGVVVYDLLADIYGMSVKGLSPKSPGAELIWLRSELGDMSYFSGRVTAGDVSTLFAEFGEEKVLTSDQARFDLELQWPGAPDAIGLNKLLGTIDFDLQRGRFIRGAEVGENPVVKLLGLLNFDTLTRRLRLDFSDLNPEGLGYERVRGLLAFKEGIIEVNQPLQVDSPASHIQFVGDIDLLKQTVDAQLVTTFPITGNLTMAAALTGVLPAAVGVFVVGKLFKEQIDKVSSIRYNIKGNWNEPKVEVEKVFENQTNHQRGRG